MFDFTTNINIETNYEVLLCPVIFLNGDCDCVCDQVWDSGEASSTAGRQPHRLNTVSRYFLCIILSLFYFLLHRVCSFSLKIKLFFSKTSRKCY